jgi:lipopolysaccharide biosynthesis glycosyltransferase
MPAGGDTGDLSSRPYGPTMSPLNGEISATDPLRQGIAAAGAGPVHLLLCTNAAFLQHAAVCLTSILVNNPNLFFDIVIVGRPGELLQRDKLRRSLARYPNHLLTIREFSAPPDVVLPLNPRAHYTIDSWTRLWVADFFPPEVDRVLYLDCDVVVLGSIEPLWNVDLAGALLGAIDIPGADRGVVHLGLRAEDGYFNSGVLLFDLREWRNKRALDTVLAYVAAYPELMTRDVDQEALNACFHGHRKRLDYRWNATSMFFSDPCLLPLPPHEIDAIRRDARIIHFNGNLKPWSYFCEHPRKDEYAKYLRMTEWRDFVPPDRTLANRLRKLASVILPQKAKTLLKEVMPAIAKTG